MIKRKYFFSVKVAHNNGTGTYSWYQNIIHYSSWVPNQQMLLDDLRENSAETLNERVAREIDSSDIEVIAFNRI